MSKNKKLDILYEDKNIIAVNKHPHYLTIATENEKIKTLYHEVLEYLYKKNKNNRVYIVHRLDKDTSGIVVFAKNKETKDYLQENWNDITLREYYAIVEGKVFAPGEVKEYLAEDKTLRTYKTDSARGKLAITRYDVIKASNNYSILNVEIKTGRKNQIRVAMQDINHPIIGDKKYGSTKNPLRRICLHHYHLKFKLYGNELDINAKIPSEFGIFK